MAERWFKHVFTVGIVQYGEVLCQKLAFLRKGDQYLVTLNDRPWQ